MTSDTEPARSNLINIGNPDAPIYRTFRLIHLREALRDQKMALVEPALWDDPLENPVAHCAIVDERAEEWQQHFLGNERKDVFGQCWSLRKESDAIWRIYSTIRKDPTNNRNAAIDDEGIRVQSTPRKLLQASRSTLGQTCYCGSVNYFPLDTAMKQIADEIRRSMKDAYSSDRGHADALLIKRQEFDHEHEVRLLFIDASRRYHGSKLLFVDIDPNFLFEEMVLDPRLSADDIRERTKELQTLGFTGPISRSDLYQKRLFEVVIR